MSPPPVPGSSSSASISSSCVSDSFWPSRSKNLTPLYSGGLWDAVMTQPRSSVKSATAGVGSTPATTALPPTEAIPRASDCSSSGPDARVPRPMKIRPRPDHNVAARPRRSTSSGVRSLPTTPRTPSVPKYFRAKLPLAELRRLARLVQARLLALDDTSVARQEAGPLERNAQLRVRLDERSGDSVPDGACLPARTAAVHAHPDVVGPLGSGDLERRERGRPVRLAREVVLDRATVEPGDAVAGSEDDAGDRSLPLAGPTVLRDLAHASSHFSGCGACGACGCSGPA